MKEPYYPNFMGECARKGISMNEIASTIKCTPRALSNKVNGRTQFTWPEVDTIHKTYFQDVSKDYLMKPSRISK